MFRFIRAGVSCGHVGTAHNMLTPISGSPPGSGKFVVKFVYEDTIPAANTLQADCLCGYEAADLTHVNCEGQVFCDNI